MDNTITASKGQPFQTHPHQSQLDWYYYNQGINPYHHLISHNLEPESKETDLRIELSVVQSPKVFGADTLTTSEVTLEKDERMIERHMAGNLKFVGLKNNDRKPAPISRSARRPSSAPPNNLDLDASSHLFKKPNNLDQNNSTAPFELASPLKISTSNMLTGLNPLLSMPPISPLKSPSGGGVIKKQQTHQESLPKPREDDDSLNRSLPTCALNALEGRKRSDSFSSSLLCPPPIKKRPVQCSKQNVPVTLTVNSDSENEASSQDKARQIQNASQESTDSQPPVLKPAISLDSKFCPDQNYNFRSLSVETVAQYDHLQGSAKKSAECRSASNECIPPAIMPKSLPPDISASMKMMGGGGQQYCMYPPQGNSRPRLSLPGSILSVTADAGPGSQSHHLGAGLQKCYENSLRPSTYPAPYSPTFGSGYPSHHQAFPRFRTPGSFVSQANVGMLSSANRYPHPDFHGSSTTPPKSSNLQYNIIQEIRNLPHGNCFQLAVNSWEVYTIDSVELPCLTRGTEKYLAVHMVQMKLLSKFPPNVPQELMRKHRMVSHKMTIMESWVLNTINAVHCKYEYGFQLFSPADDLVKGTDVKHFYYAVKVYNFERILDVYKHEIRATADLHVSLTAHISSLKAFAEEELKSIRLAGSYDPAPLPVSRYMPRLPRDFPIPEGPEAMGPHRLTYAQSQLHPGLGRTPHPVPSYPYLNGQADPRTDPRVYSGQTLNHKISPTQPSGTTQHQILSSSLRSPIHRQYFSSAGPYAIRSPLAGMMPTGGLPHDQQAVAALHRMVPPSPLSYSSRNGVHLSGPHPGVPY